MPSPPVEEFVFREMLFAGFSRSWGVWAASILVTVLFVSIHLPETVHYIPAVLVQVLFSFAALVARITTRSLLPSVVLHAAYNLGVVTILYVSLAISR
jgi:membrane protease YdiL (CAAX protease family)